MASISLAELYFRSLKRTKVLSLLTKYLLQYRKLCIPHIGTFEMLQNAPEFNVVDKLILPPSFQLHLLADDFVPEHQVHYLATSIRRDSKSVREELDMLGKKIKSKVQKQPFSLNGFGTISSVSDSVSFSAEPVAVYGFEPVSAIRMIRENVEHSVLVGDQQMTSRQVTDTLSQSGKKRSNAVLIGWILFILALLAIAFILYKEGFNPLSSGLRRSP
jgi:hypothetical protein